MSMLSSLYALHGEKIHRARDLSRGKNADKPVDIRAKVVTEGNKASRRTDVMQRGDLGEAGKRLEGYVRFYLPQSNIGSIAALCRDADNSPHETSLAGLTEPLTMAP